MSYGIIYEWFFLKKLFEIQMLLKAIQLTSCCNTKQLHKFQDSNNIFKNFLKFQYNRISNYLK